MRAYLSLCGLAVMIAGAGYSEVRGGAAMGKLVYMTNISMDGYTEDATGNFRFTAPNNVELHHWLLQHVASFRVSLMGRRMYETMLYWNTSHEQPDQSPEEIAFARDWQTKQKVVYSRTLTEVRSANTLLDRRFDSELLRSLKGSVDGTIGIGGPAIAALALQAGLVDEVHLRICPVMLGGGKKFWPDGLRLDMKLLEERRFTNGDVFVRYATVT